MENKIRIIMNITGGAASSQAVTLKDIAAFCGVSLGTVSLALRGDSRISTATTHRVLAAAAELGYDPSQSQAARRLALRKHGRDVLNHVIALVVPSVFHHPGYFSEIMQGVMDVLVPAGYSALITYIYTHEDGRAVEAPVPLRSGIVDGMISMVRPEPVSELLEQLRRQPGFAARPVVSAIWRQPGCSAICADDEDAGYTIMRRLLAMGHRYFAQLTFLWPYAKATEPQTCRVQGAHRALTEAGLEPDQHLRLVDLMDYNWLNPEHIAETAPSKNQVVADGQEMLFVDLLHAHSEITAILGLNDATALRAWRLLEEVGYRVPEEISIVGFDDTTPRLDAAGINQLSSVRIPLMAIGREAAALVIQQVTGEAPNAPAELLQPVEVCFRGSVGPARA